MTAWSEYADLIVVTTAHSEPDIPGIKVSQRPVHLGDSVWLIGSDDLQTIDIRWADAKGFHVMPYQDSVLNFVAGMKRGHSGSPVLDSAGELIGIACRLDSDQHNLNFATPSAYFASMDFRHTAIPLSLWVSESIQHDSTLALRVPSDFVTAGNVRWRSGEKVAAVALYDTALHLYDSRKRQGLNAMQVDSFAMGLFAKGLYAKAARALEIELFANLDDARLHHDLGSCFARMDRGDDAIGEYQIAVQINPKLVAAHFDLGLTELQYHQDKQAARKEYESLQPLDSKAAERLLQLIGR